MGKKKYLLDEAIKISFGGEEYYLRLRSNNLQNPVALFLHGGPGSCDRAFVMQHQSALADRCTVAAWDQRGTGLAYDAKRAKKEALTKEVYVQDAFNVMSYLCKRFAKQKIILIGHSFGSQFGVWVCEKHPELIEAFVGVGQFIDSIKNEDISFKFTLDEAVKRNDKRAVKKLNQIGPPESGFYKHGRIITQRNYLHKYGGATYSSKDNMIVEYLKMLPVLLKEYTVFQLMSKYLRGINYSLNSPMAQNRENFIETVKRLDVPILLFLGHHDYNCPYLLAEEWLSGLDAPYKKLIWFEKSAHSPFWEEPHLWNEMFIKEVIGKMPFQRSV